MLVSPPPTWVPPRLTCFLAGSARTGSSYLARLMKDTGQLGWPREFFNPRMLTENLIGGSSDLVSPRPPPGPDEVAWRCDLVRIVGQSGNGIASTKLFPDHLRWMAKGVHIAEWFPTFRFVHLSRDDKLRQAISAAIAAETKVWQGLTDATRPEPAFSAEKIDSLLRYILAGGAMWEAYFLRNRIAPLRLTYEELDLDPASTLRRVASYLDVDLPPAPIDGGPYVRQRGALTEEWRERYLAAVADLNLPDGLVPPARKKRRFRLWPFGQRR